MEAFCSNRKTSRFARRTRARPGRRRLSSDHQSLAAAKARVIQKVPGLFVLQHPAGGIGIRAGLRNRFFRVRIPGGVPDFSWKQFASTALLQLGCGKASDPAARRTAPMAGSAAGGVFPSSVRTVALQAAYAGSNPAGNAIFHLAVAQQASARGPGPRGRRFESCRRDQSIPL